MLNDLISFVWKSAIALFLVWFIFFLIGLGVS